MRNSEYVWISIYCLNFVTLCFGATDEDANRLYRDKVYPLNPRLRPLKNQSEILTVRMKLYFTAITDFDETLQKLSTTSWLQVKWTDELVAWNATDYGGIRKISPDPDHIWRPSVSPSHTFDENRPVGGNFVSLSVLDTGEVTWSPGTKLETFCRLDVSKYPFDEQQCILDFFNWGTTAEELILTTYDGGIDAEGFYESGEWELMEVSVRDYVGIYDNGLLKKPQVEISFTIKRRPSIVVLTVLLPVMLLSFINVCAFILPADSGEKLSFAVTVLLSLAVFLTFINSMMPQTSETRSYLSLYLAAQLFVSSVIVVVSSLSMSIHYRKHRANTSKEDRVLLRLFTKYDEEVKKDLEDDNKCIFQHISKRFDYICLIFFTSFTVIIAVIFLMALFL